MSTNNQHQRIIVVGTSAGGLEVLQTLVAGLDPDLPAALLVVRHLAADSPPVLATLLEKAGPLPAVAAQDGDPIVAGRIVVAPADRHLMVEADGQRDARVRLTRGPRQNRARPAIDVLFRSAAVAYSTHTIGVLLTGMLDDGVIGLRAIYRCGGVTVVQEPAEAPYPEMVETALATMPVDYQLPVAEIARLLNRLSRERISKSGDVPQDLQLEVAINRAADSKLDELAIIADGTTLSCPECGGRLWQTADADPQHYLCEVGHSYNQQTLLEGMDREIESSLWVALRTLEERARMLERMAREEDDHGRKRAALSFQERAVETRKDSENVRRFLLRSGRPQTT